MYEEACGHVIIFQKSSLFFSSNIQENVRFQIQHRLGKMFGTYGFIWQSKASTNDTYIGERERIRNCKGSQKRIWYLCLAATVSSVPFKRG